MTKKEKEQQYIKWKKLSRFNQEKCKRLDKERDIWYNDLKKEIKDKSDKEIAQIKTRELKKITNNIESSMKKFKDIYKKNG